MKDLLVVGNIAKDVVFGRETYGGSASAIAVNAARLGLKCGILSLLANDSFSRSYRDFLLSNNIDVSLIENKLFQLPLCEVFSIENKTSSRRWHDNGCRVGMENMNFDIKSIDEYKIIHLVTCPPNLAKRILSSKSMISLEPGPMIHVDPTYIDEDLINKSQIIFLNEEEFYAASDILKFNNPFQFIHINGQILVITRGSKGSDIFYKSSDNYHHIHKEAVNPQGKIVDHNGAGDCYKSGFLMGLMKEKSLEECATIGAEMGAACVTQNGGILDGEKINKIIGKHASKN